VRSGSAGEQGEGEEAGGPARHRVGFRGGRERPSLADARGNCGP
jgi:hypothetical protein